MARRFPRVGLVLAIGTLLLQPASEALARRRPASSETKRTATLQFQLSLDQTSYSPSDQILARFSLKNTGAQPVWVTKRLYLSAQETPPAHRDVFLEITSPSGTLLRSTYTHQTGFPKCDDFEQLDPGKEVAGEGQHNLRSYFELKEPGTYQVVAVYENVFGPEIGLETFQGVVRSAPVTLTITQ